MKDLLYKITDMFAFFHNSIMTLNDSCEHFFSDKELHLIVMGVLGMLLVALFYPVFRWLSRKGHVMALTCIYVLTLLLVTTFAIEIGQKVTNTGTMEFMDIVYGMAGFVLFFAVFLIVMKVIRVLKDRRVKGRVRRPDIHSSFRLSNDRRS